MKEFLLLLALTAVSESPVREAPQKSAQRECTASNTKGPVRDASRDRTLGRERTVGPCTPKKK